MQWPVSPRLPGPSTMTDLAAGVPVGTMSGSSARAPPFGFLSALTIPERTSMAVSVLSIVQNDIGIAIFASKSILLMSNGGNRDGNDGSSCSGRGAVPNFYGVQPAAHQIALDVCVLRVLTAVPPAIGQHFQQIRRFSELSWRCRRTPGCPHMAPPSPYGCQWWGLPQRSAIGEDNRPRASDSKVSPSRYTHNMTANKRLAEPRRDADPGKAPASRLQMECGLDQWLIRTGIRARSAMSWVTPPISPSRSGECS